MRIGGFRKFSLIDYPGKVAAVVFTQGCNFRCRFCYNQELVLPECFQKPFSEQEVLDFLKTRQGKLEGVVVTGGEPTIQPDLLVFLDKLKRLGYWTKLDTNGSHPEIIRKLINLHLVNYIAMDFKAPLEKYEHVVGVSIDVERIKESIEVILESGLAHEFRTTVVKSLCSLKDIELICSLIQGTERYTIQKFIPKATVIDKKILLGDQYSDGEIEELKSKWERVLV